MTSQTKCVIHWKCLLMIQTFIQADQNFYYKVYKKTWIVYVNGTMTDLQDSTFQDVNVSNMEKWKYACIYQNERH